MVYIGIEWIICLYKNNCVSYPYKCRKCRHNKGKKDHFEPLHKLPKHKPSKWEWKILDGRVWYRHGVIHGY